ncbi:transmembrane amino acid transporter protein [Oesophagostomum dentatum]|uniref:Transmembrane amino acid transporter protein n=1 Tax=Oesophagostomum dentatum TaxID=61180 RepID=A0A0B1T187_OESDE|nr:transmembrane amino acid transporter protein [Oesophagostomum dentatum]
MRRLALDYGEMAAEAFASRRLEPLRIFAIPAMVIANLCVMGLQLGFCSAFYIFVVDHSKEAIDHIFSTNFSRDSLFFIALPFFLFIGSIRNLVILSWIGLMGNVLLVASMGIIVVKMILMDHYPFSQLPSYTSVEGAMLSAGSIVYAFASQGVILPLENKMKKPKEMFGPRGVITTASIVIFFINTVTGFLGYVTYGQELKGSITLNLTNSPLDFTVKIMLLVMTYCGYPIEIYPVVEMLWPYVERYVDSSRKRVVSALQYALQYAAVMVSFGFAYAIPNFKDIIPFIGITSGMMLALILPPVLETVVFLGRWRKGGIIKFLCNVAHNLIYLVLGIIFIVVGLYSNYRNLSNADKS